VCAYAGGNLASNTDPLGLFLTSADAACVADPNFCAEIMGRRKWPNRRTRGKTLTWDEYRELLDRLPLLSPRITRRRVMR
jgi:hypothetical protein